jgi:hypothetical protein
MARVGQRMRRNTCQCRVLLCASIAVRQCAMAIAAAADMLKAAVDDQTHVIAQQRLRLLHSAMQHVRSCSCLTRPRLLRLSSCSKDKARAIHGHVAVGMQLLIQLHCGDTL